MHSYYLILGTWYSYYHEEKQKTQAKTAMIVETRATAYITQQQTKDNMMEVKVISA